MGRGSCFGGWLRLGARKKEKRIAPRDFTPEGSASSSRVWATSGASQPSSGFQFSSLTPSLLAPPSSPASFQNSAVQSSAQSPSTYSVSLCAASATSHMPLETIPTMFQIGPYAHETALVSPPVFSTFTTAPSTAPFTPPPEPATHVTTPSSPDVPFAQLLASSFEAKGSARQQPHSSHSASPNVVNEEDIQESYEFYRGSPLANFIPPTLQPKVASLIPELELSPQSCSFPAQECNGQGRTFSPNRMPPAQKRGARIESDMQSEALNRIFVADWWEEKHLLDSATVAGHSKSLPLIFASGSFAREEEKQDLPVGEKNPDVYDITFDTLVPNACKTGEGVLRSKEEVDATSSAENVLGYESMNELSFSGASELVNWRHCEILAAYDMRRASLDGYV